MCTAITSSHIASDIQQALHPRNIPWRALCNKIANVALITLATVIVSLTFFYINPYFCPAALLIGMIGHRYASPLMSNELFDPMQQHPYLATLAIVVASLVAPHFAILAAGVLFNIYCGSQINQL